MISLLTALFAFGLLVSVSVVGPLLHAGPFVPDPVVIIVVYVALLRHPSSAIWAAIGTAYVAGTMTAGPRAPLLIGVLAIVGVTLWARARLPLQSAMAAAGWVVASVVLLHLVETVAALVFIEDIRLGTGLWTNAPAAALLSGVVAWPLYAILFRVEPLLRARSERGTLVGAGPSREGILARPRGLE